MASMERTVMIERIVDFSVKNRFLVFGLVAIACAAGWWSMKNVPLDCDTILTGRELGICFGD